MNKVQRIRNGVQTFKARSEWLGKARCDARHRRQLVCMRRDVLISHRWCPADSSSGALLASVSRIAQQSGCTVQNEYAYSEKHTHALRSLSLSLLSTDSKDLIRNIRMSTNSVEKPQRTRRAHAKSRHGCLQCKKRHHKVWPFSVRM